MINNFLDMTIAEIVEFFSEINNVTFRNISKFLLEMVGCVIGAFISFLLFLTFPIWILPYWLFYKSGLIENWSDEE